MRTFMVGFQTNHGISYHKMEAFTPYKIGQALTYKGRTGTVTSCIEIDGITGFAL